MTVRRLALGLALVVFGLLATLAMPVQVWRTGRMSVPPLTLSRPTAIRSPDRIWIDTDAACGHTPRTDVDDCLAVWLLATRSDPDIVGVSTVFGNAPLDATDSVTRELVRHINRARGSDPISVHRGLPDVRPAAQRSAAGDALSRALEAGPLTIVALGPLTNLADALTARPDLRRNIQRIVAVMGRRIGHLFHPSEGSGRGAFLGHGPVFRDFNFSADAEAVRAIVQTKVPLTLVPYDAATAVEITDEDLRHIATQDDAGAWIALRSRQWLEYWQTEIGRAGFYPFDLMAAAYVRAPALFRCAAVRARVGTDPLLFVPLLRPAALLVEEREARDIDGRADVYCPAVQPGFGAELRRWMSATPQDASTPSSGRQDQ
jgi:inosine-uridine nucleoside N-ribohydrolase